MKKLLIKALSLLVILCMLCPMAISCSDIFPKNTDTTDNEESNTSSPDEEKEKGSVTFDFQSNGDGTCNIVAINISGNESDITTLEFPDKSPDGETVVSIENQRFFTPYGNVPRMIEKEEFEQLYDKMMSNFAGDKEAKLLSKKLLAYYMQMDPSAITSGVYLQAMLKQYPITKHTAIYVLDLSADLDTIEKISTCLYEYGEFTSKEAQKSYENLVKIGGDELKNTILRPSTYNLPPINTVTIPTSVKQLGNSIFRGFSTLENITVPDNVTNIGEYAFADCTNLANITIPNSVTNIDEYAFADCISLTNITISNSVKEIGLYAFSSCTSLANIVLPDSIEVINGSAFEHCTSLASITIPNSVTKIESNVFNLCTNLVSVVLPDNNTIIRTLGYELLSLTTITISNSARFINYDGTLNDNVLSNAQNLTDIIFIGTTEEWKNDQWENILMYHPDPDKVTVTCTDGKLDGYGNIIA